MGTHLKIALVDDAPAIIGSLETCFSQQPGFELVFSGSNAEEAAKSLESESGFILITDLEMPVMNGIQLIQHLSQFDNDMLPLVFTIHEDRQSVFDALKAGAYGYILKGSTVEDIIDAVKLLADGGSPMSPGIARQVMTFFHEKTKTHDNLLSKREMEVLQLVDQALTYREISERLNISHNTVHVHIKNIYEKLQAKSRAEALKLARERQYI